MFHIFPSLFMTNHALLRSTSEILVINEPIRSSKTNYTITSAAFPTQYSNV